MSTLSQLSPQPLWEIFSKICSIPHPSYHEEALARHIVQCARDKGVAVERDAVGNILLRKPATPGMEDRQPVILQAHLDMVPQKNQATQHDFTRDPIIPRIDGEWVAASGTTLGADNGIGLASALAVLFDENSQHGPLEVLLTMTEEVGMEGAFGLQPGWLQGEILINTDSEEEGIIYMGCAGGIDVTTTLPLQQEALPPDLTTVTVTLNGLTGGHSGADIHLGRGNANKLLGRFLHAHLPVFHGRLISFQGGTLRNAIPREATAVVAIPQARLTEFAQCVADFRAILAQEYQQTEKNLQLTMERGDAARSGLALPVQTRFLTLLHDMPNGVVRMSHDMEDVVETSLNVGVITMDDKAARICCLVRSLNESGKETVVTMLQALGSLAQADVNAQGSYPGWQPDPDSAIIQLVQQTYQRLFNAVPEVRVIHAGLECGLFKQPYPALDMVSIGPTIVGAHSPDERVHIDSVGRYWTLLNEVLKNIPRRA